MQLTRLLLTQFKNYDQAEFRFDNRIICFAGPNGIGKTNVLDAIHYLSTTKSAFSGNDHGTVQHGKHDFTVYGEVATKGERNTLGLQYDQKKGKRLMVNEEAVQNFSSFIGRFPSVVISPYDTDLIREGSEFRRKFLDYTLSVIDPDYLTILLNYNRQVKQRNQLLRAFMEKPFGTMEKSLLDVYDAQLYTYGTQIYTRRKSFVDQYVPVFNELYQHISSSSERGILKLRTKLDEQPLDELLFTNRENDRLLGRTSVGVHKDDLVFHTNNYLTRKHASQGQQKSYVLALKLAQYQSISAANGTAPFLLLDDLFDRLDAKRIERLMEVIQDKKDAQTFITDTDPNRLKKLLPHAEQHRPDELYK